MPSNKSNVSILFAFKVIKTNSRERSFQLLDQNSRSVSTQQTHRQVHPQAKAFFEVHFVGITSVPLNDMKNFRIHQQKHWSMNGQWRSHHSFIIIIPKKGSTLHPSRQTPKCLDLEWWSLGLKETMEALFLLESLQTESKTIFTFTQIDWKFFFSSFNLQQIQIPSFSVNFLLILLRSHCWI